MLIYNRPYIILVATGDRAYVNLHPWTHPNFRIGSQARIERGGGCATPFRYTFC